jgi:hypothetical protein
MDHHPEVRGGHLCANEQLDIGLGRARRLFVDQVHHPEWNAGRPSTLVVVANGIASQPVPVTIR